MCFVYRHFSPEVKKLWSRYVYTIHRTRVSPIICPPSRNLSKVIGRVRSLTVLRFSAKGESAAGPPTVFSYVY